MFGYVTPEKPELKVKEFECYKAMYCGLCMQLKKEYGLVSRFLLNYDLVTVALLADGLCGEAGSPCMKRCMANPRKRCMQSDTNGLSLAAGALVLLSWYKLQDDISDEAAAKKAAAGSLRVSLKKAYKKAAGAFPQLDECLAVQTQKQQELEQKGCNLPDEAADPTGCMTAAVFAQCAANPQQKHVLERLGLFLGKILYWLDAAEDYEKDKAGERYNVFINMGLTKQQAVEQTRLLCRMAAGEVARCYNLLCLKLNKPILDNIVFLGIGASIEKAGQPARRNNHGALH